MWKYPVRESWLPLPVWQLLKIEADSLWQSIDATAPDKGNAFDFMHLQNKGMLIKFFLEQAFGDGMPGGRELRLIEREFGTVDRFREILLDLSSRRDVSWVTWGLSFATGRFHVFPVSEEEADIPFCTSPMFVLCTRQDIVDRLGLDRRPFAELQLNNVAYGVVERRIACLERPLNVFQEMADCQNDVCS